MKTDSIVPPRRYASCQKPVPPVSCRKSCHHCLCGNVRAQRSVSRSRASTAACPGEEADGEHQVLVQQ